MTKDPFEHFDAAYVLGMLDQEERRDFEAHLLTCAECRARVAEVQPTATLLAGMPREVFAEADHTADEPDTLLPGLLRRARKERSRRRGVVLGLGAAVAASVAALIAVLLPSGAGSSHPPAQALAAVRPSPVSATARLVDRQWGTEIDLQCRYSAGTVSYAAYELVVTDSNGVRHEAGSWRLAPGGETNFTGGTAVPRSKIDRVQVTRSDGTPILELDE